MGEIKNDGETLPRGVMWMGPVGTPPNDWVDPGNPDDDPDDGEPVEWTNVGYMTSDGASYREPKPVSATFMIERTLRSTTITRTTADGVVTRIYSPHDQTAETMWEQILDQIQHVDPTSAEHIRSEYQRWQQTAAAMPDMPFARYWYDSMVSDQPPASATRTLDQTFGGGIVETFGQHATDAFHRLQAAARVDWPTEVTSWEQTYADRPAGYNPFASRPKGCAKTGQSDLADAILAARRAQAQWLANVTVDDVLADLAAEEETRIRRWYLNGGGD